MFSASPLDVLHIHHDARVASGAPTNAYLDSIGVPELAPALSPFDPG